MGKIYNKSIEEARRNKFFGFVPVVGSSIDYPGFVHDDRGITPQKAGRLLRNSRANAVYACGIDWSYIQPEKDQEYDFSIVDAQMDGLLSDGIEPFGYLTYYRHPEWLERECSIYSEEYWHYADSFMFAAVEELNRKGIRYFIFENEPNMYGKQYWYLEYMEHLRHGFKVIKSVSKFNIVIAGNLSEQAGKPGGAWELLYQNGFREYSDVVGYHPYSDDPRTGIDIEDAAEAHEIMVKYGDYDKPMFFGEGWGPKRLLKKVPRSGPEVKISGEELDTLDMFISNGYKRMMTKTDIWDPGWLIGALFFTLNDNWGKYYWKDRAVHADNDGDGIPDTWYIDNIWLGTEADLEPEFYNGGLTHADGTPKEGVFEYFPEGRIK